MKANLKKTNNKRVVIIGGGFAGLQLAQKLRNQDLQVVLIDKNNYHQFQPLFYQVATAGLEPSTISFPFRKIFQRTRNVYIRVTEVLSVDTTSCHILTGVGKITYDYLVVAIGTDTNFFGNQNIMKYALPMKSLREALEIRNRILQNFEDALSVESPEELQGYMNIVVVGGGPSGVEVCGTLAEMKRYILPKDYPELDFSKMKIYLLEASQSLLSGMSEIASKKAREYLEKLGVTICTGSLVKDYDGMRVFIVDGSPLRTRTLIWAAGVTGNKIKGLPPDSLARGGRIVVDGFCRVKGFDNLFAIGDIAFMTDKKYPNGHPQLAQVAIQQAKNLAGNLKKIIHAKELVPFSYKDKGALATVGRNLAVADLPNIKLRGFLAWVVWMLVHLMAIVGVKNRIFIFIDWAWSYFTYDQSLRLIIRSAKKEKYVEEKIPL